MAHTGEEIVLRLVELLDLLFLLLGEGVFLLIHPIQEHEQHTGEQAYHNHGKRGVKEGALLGIHGGDFREVVGDAVAQHRLRHAQPEKHGHAFPPQGDADIDEAEHKPLRHPAVEPARGKECEGEEHQQQYHDGRGPRLDALLSDAELHDHRYGRQAYHEDHEIQNTPAHRQGEYQRNHADHGHNAEYALTHTDPVIREDLKPFFNHAVSHSF